MHNQTAPLQAVTLREFQTGRDQVTQDSHRNDEKS